MLILKRPFFLNVIKCVYMCNFPHAMYFLNYLDLPLCLPCSTWPLSVEKVVLYPVLYVQGIRDGGYRFVSEILAYVTVHFVPWRSLLNLSP
uniref:Uncharacterized protein n=1 Tax=Anguilla anguilla TaxID=7936 RepID=A0A0E9V2C1_ANGAN